MAKAWRYEWAAHVRACRALSSTARLVAQVLALDFANGDTGQCNPSRSTLADHLGMSLDTIKRSLAELEREGWLAKVAGRGRGKKSSFTFLSPGKVVRMPVAAQTQAAERPVPRPHASPEKGGKSAPDCTAKKGANLRGKGCKSAPSYNNDRNLVRTIGAQVRAWRSHTFLGRNYPGPSLVREDNWQATSAWGRWLQANGYPPLRNFPIVSDERKGTFFHLPSNLPPSCPETEREAREYFNSLLDGEAARHAAQ
ncbi:Helix-turn-helix domain-containing protein [Mameliella alba]|nr:helix-turn-helix domain-containing protein [Mameliella alba]PTR36995.1 helix-turn-helix protein [Mameliella alba]GGF77074.1 hypothetical protein GCM10011319_41800 [Mameliella alba]SDD81461.1 Helix-turn-helix domain-containing protein [Mameliella alba]